MKLLILANHYNTLRIFRRELIRELARENDVTVSIPECDSENKRLLESYGAKVVFTTFDRRGRNPFNDLKLLLEYKRLMRALAPDEVICYTVKCNIYGALASSALKVRHCVNITGLGSPIEQGGVTGKLVLLLYRLALRKAHRVFFENEGDRDRLVNAGVIRAGQAFVLPGAGVNLSEFAFAPYPPEDGVTRFLFIGRIMREKGVDELFEAIRRLHAAGIRFSFDFIGWYEENYADTVKQLEAQGLIRFHGFQQDVRPYIERCHCSVLPSWHEGMSNTLLECASVGRALITTSVHGCMEAVDDTRTGLLVPVRDADALYNALSTFISLTHAQKADMGALGRRRMEELFDKRHVVALTMRELFGE